MPFRLGDDPETARFALDAAISVGVRHNTVFSIQTRVLSFSRMVKNN